MSDVDDQPAQGECGKRRDDAVRDQGASVGTAGGEERVRQAEAGTGHSRSQIDRIGRLGEDGSTDHPETT